jgi:hypothetical protein
LFNSAQVTGLEKVPCTKTTGMGVLVELTNRLIWSARGQAFEIEAVQARHGVGAGLAGAQSVFLDGIMLALRDHRGRA